jgi:alkaline phosphatase D
MTEDGKNRPTVSRRWFLRGASGFAAAPAISGPAEARPLIMDGVTAGDVTANSAVIWARSDRIARLYVDWSTDEKFRKTTQMPFQTVTARSGHTGQVILNNLPSGRDIFYRARFDSPDGLITGAAATGRLRTAGRGRGVSFVFGGDQCGGGWGINPDTGGLRLFETMRTTDPDFLVHLGDRIYADRILSKSVLLEDGSRWTNLVTPAKEKVAETLDEYRGNYSYNFLDAHYRRFSASVPMMATWDDHEVANDWWPGRRFRRRFMQRKGYDTPSVDDLARNAREAFFNFTPMRRQSGDADRIYRKVSYGPMVDVFLLDTRSYRSANDLNDQAEPGERKTLLGAKQAEWLKTSLAESRAVWKFVCNSVPIAHVRKVKKPRYDKWANGDHGQPRGREFELASILSHLKTYGVRNVVWLAADVHYCAATFFDPGRASFQDFNPFWEFIAGPFHTRPGRVRNQDRTFGPDRRYRTPVSATPNPPPSADNQYFGHAQIDAGTGKLIVTFRDGANRVLFSHSMLPDR